MVRNGEINISDKNYDQNTWRKLIIDNLKSRLI
jgi:hypothetical protein